MRVAFSGSGLLFPIHLGAYIALRSVDKSELTEVSGVSGGSLIAALLACFPITEVDTIIHSLDLGSAIEYNPTAIFSRGYSYGANIELDLDVVFGDMTFQDTRIPLYVTASDIRSGQPVVFSTSTHPKMLIKTALRASIAIPLVFTPVKYEGMLLVDGAILESTPVRVFPRDTDTNTYGIRIRGNRSSSYGGFSYFIRLATMMASAIDHVYIDYDKLDETTELFFLDTPYDTLKAYDNNDLIDEGISLMTNKLVSSRSKSTS